MNEKKNSLIPPLLRQRRELAGLSVEEVADKLRTSYGIELSPKTIYGYENGVSLPKVPVFMALCTIYGVRDPYQGLGFETRLSFVSGEDDWDYSLYNDFFNASPHERVYLLLSNGIPTFKGYEAQLEASFPSDAESANFSRLYSLFASLSESRQGAAFFLLDELAAGHHPNLTSEELSLISALRNAPSDVQSAVRTILSAYSRNP